jgi:hypothetical protein
MYLMVSAAVLGEILWVVLGFFSHFRRGTELNSQAFAYAVITALAVFSLSLFGFFLVGAHDAYFLFDVLLISLSACLVYRNWTVLGAALRSGREFCRRNLGFALFLPALASIPFLKGFLLPPTTYDSLAYHLTRVMMMKAEGQLFLDNFSDYRLDIMPVGYELLHFLFLRFHTDFGLATFGFLGYAAVVAAVYALVHRLWSDEGLATTIALIAASLTMFVLHAASTKNDLILAAVTAVVFLAAYNYRASKSLTDLHVLGIALGFGAAVKYNFSYMGLAFLAGFLVLLVREWGLAETGRRIGRFCTARGGALLVLPLGLAGMLVAVLGHNLVSYGHVLGPEFYMPSFSGIDGLRGGAVNLARFVVQMANLPMEIFGLTATKLHNALLGDNISLGVLWWPGFPALLETSFAPPEEAAWFGVLGLPILVAMVHGAVRGDGFIKVMTLSALVVIVLTAMTTSWSPWRGRYYAGPMVAGLIALGFWFHLRTLDRPRFTKWLRHGVVAISAANLFYLTAVVTVVDFPGLKELFNDRDAVYGSTLGNRPAWRRYVDDTPQGARVLLITGLNARLFPLYLRRPDLAITTTGVRSEYFREPLTVDGADRVVENPDHFRMLAGSFDRVMLIDVPKKFRDYATALVAEMKQGKDRPAPSKTAE